MSVDLHSINIPQNLLIASLESFYLDSSSVKQCPRGPILQYSYCFQTNQTLFCRFVVGLQRLLPYTTLHLTRCITLLCGFIHSWINFSSASVNSNLLYEGKRDCLHTYQPLFYQNADVVMQVERGYSYEVMLRYFSSLMYQSDMHWQKYSF